MGRYPLAVGTVHGNDPLTAVNMIVPPVEDPSAVPNEADQLVPEGQSGFFEGHDVDPRGKGGEVNLETHGRLLDGELSRARVGNVPHHRGNVILIDARSKGEHDCADGAGFDHSRNVHKPLSPTDEAGRRTEC